MKLKKLGVETKLVSRIEDDFFFNEINFAQGTLAVPVTIHEITAAESKYTLRLQVYELHKI